jgi:hypothetical protein
MVSRELRNKTILWMIVAVGTLVVILLFLSLVHFGTYTFWIILILVAIVLVLFYKATRYGGRYIDELAKENLAKRRGQKT